MIKEILLAIKTDIETALTLTDVIYIDNLPEAGGISMQPDGGPPTYDLAKKKKYNEDITFFRKSQDQALCMDELDLIGDHIEDKTFCVGDFKVYDISVSVSTRKVTKQLDGFYIYTMVLEVKIYGS